MITSNHKKLASIGECMIEMSPQPDGHFRLGFAGDTLNATIYMARYRPSNWIIQYVTAIGNDPFSIRMLEEWQNEHIDISCVRQIAGQLPGLYLIQNDPRGERFFYYYRQNSAARSMFEGTAGDELCAQLLQCDMLYLSGITLAILQESSRNKLMTCLQAAHAKGIRIVFDSNFRKALWPDLAAARQMIQDAYALSTIALPSFDDEKLLFGDKTAEQSAQRLSRLGVSEIVVKQGESGYYLHNPSEKIQVPARPQTHVVDTTGAGDSFNGVYLAYRLQDLSPNAAAQKAAETAAQVVAHRGAILPRAC